MSTAGLFGALAIGCAAALLVSWAATTRARAAVSRRARAQLGLVADPDDGRPTASETIASRLPSARISLLAVAIAVVGVGTIGPAGGVLGALPPLVARSITASRRRRRTRALDTALGPMLQSIVDQLRVGRSLLSALESAGPTAGEPLAALVQRIVNDVRLGGSVADSLAVIATEERHRHLEVIASAVALHSQQGGSLTEILVGVAESIEDEDRLRRDMLTLTADARLSANVLLAMPIGALIITSLLSPGYATPLVTTPVGRLLSITGLVLGAVGVSWLRMLARPEEL